MKDSSWNIHQLVEISQLDQLLLCYSFEHLAVLPASPESVFLDLVVDIRYHHHYHLLQAVHLVLHYLDLDSQLLTLQLSRLTFEQRLKSELSFMQFGLFDFSLLYLRQQFCLFMWDVFPGLNGFNEGFVLFDLIENHLEKLLQRVDIDDKLYVLVGTVQCKFSLFWWWVFLCFCCDTSKGSSIRNQECFWSYRHLNWLYCT